MQISIYTKVADLFKYTRGNSCFQNHNYEHDSTSTSSEKMICVLISSFE